MLTASVSSFQISLPSGVSLLASAAPLIDIDEPDRLVEPAIVRARNVIAWTLPSEGFATARLTAPLHLRLGTQNKSDRCAIFATAPFSSGALDLGSRAFFIFRVTGYDVRSTACTAINTRRKSPKFAAGVDISYRFRLDLPTGLKPHNPLLDVVDDPALEDLSESEA
ncbi:BZ3500_MvSof-1268-A1-R1_C104g00571 [Microbotryum saponariae]|uniref:BZ3500_MvSof-1268-A1-R1_C104g00571 protein n=1 Tax=Microbotryum saponariae TaxID=289078 RepID=A0A2X0LLF5_9BASI|nr:BZ3500_MvSof-1268-A1-R1_C104g00571 [Microbotryum saponariae]